MPHLTTFLTYDNQAEQAVNHYLAVFEHGHIVSTMRMPAGGPAPAGAVLSVTFDLLGQRMVALNGGPSFAFSQGISLFVGCDSQDEIDRYWTGLTDGGGKEGRCGWLTDKFGVSWQIVPNLLGALINSKDASKSGGAMSALMQMKKLDIAALKRASELD
jgi:predicted 3-demethylubiquinone-9 3-methyltransferase (glyoxalase superfamily)